MASGKAPGGGDAEERPPLVSVLVLGYNGREHLARCLPTLLEQTYPRDCIEIIVVDNASIDGTADYVEAHFPGVQVVRNRENYGFARGNNIGAQAARGRYVAFLNQDTRVSPDWLEELLRPILEDQRHGDGRLVCTGSKILDWDGELVDFAGARMNFLGKGSQFGFRQVDGPSYSEPRPLLFACGGSMLIDRRIFLESGGFDEDFFVFFEDVDLGWRLWVLGYRVQLVPTAITYHRLHGSTGELHDVRKRLIYERNALLTIIKNYDDDNLGRVLPAALLLTVQQVLAELKEAGVDPADYDIRGRSGIGTHPVAIYPATISLLLALRDLMEMMPAMMAKRVVIQAQRRRPDAEIVPLFGGPLEPLATATGHAEATFRVAEVLGVSEIFDHVPRHVLVVTPDILPLPGLPTSGSGLRAWGIGQGLASRGHQVTYSMHKVGLDYAGGSVPDTARAVAWDEQTLSEVVARVNPDVVIVAGWYPAVWLETNRIPVVIDQHGPHMLERSFHKEQYVEFMAGARQKLAALAKADFFTCAGERQRFYFEPWLMQAGFDLTQAEEQPAVVPLSMSPELPEHRPEGEPAFVFGGVFLPWQDPSAALTTLVETLDRHERGRLMLFGGAHPLFPEVGTGIFPRLRAQLEGSPRASFEPMVPRETLLALYARAHAAIDLMARNPERELAFTTRTVEYLWCGLPVIYNNYGELSELIREYEAGWTLDPEDHAGLIAVVEGILRDPEGAAKRGRNAQRLVRERLTWERTVEPLDRFVRRPRIRRKDRPSFLVGMTPAEKQTAVPPPAPPRVPEAYQPVLQRMAARRRSPVGRTLAQARLLAKAALQVDRPTPHAGSMVHTVGELTGTVLHAQRFAATANGLSGIGVRFGTYGRLNTQEVILRLRADGMEEDLVVVPVNASLLRDGDFEFFRFEPLADSLGRHYIFSLESPGSVRGDAVTIWAEAVSADRTEQRYENGRPAAGRLSYRLEYESPARR